MKQWLCALVAALVVAQAARAQGVGTLIVSVHSKDGPVAQAEVQAGSVTRMTGGDGNVTILLPPGPIDVVVTRTGFDPGAAQVEIRVGMESRIDVALEPQSELEENVIVSATRAEQRIDDVPLRVEVVPNEEVQEKIAMAPGDVSMLLAETNGLRVQTTSPSLGGASVRIQGLSGRYTQVLSDGLPLYGAQSGSVGILQIPPMDLQQVEVIKGVASALYGMSAIGGVVTSSHGARAPAHQSTSF
jgi:outer membrane receptor protein involved in Fe transport